MYIVYRASFHYSEQIFEFRSQSKQTFQKFTVYTKTKLNNQNSNRDFCTGLSMLSIKTNIDTSHDMYQKPLSIKTNFKLTRASIFSVGKCPSTLCKRLSFTNSHSILFPEKFRQKLAEIEFGHPDGHWPAFQS